MIAESEISLRNKHVPEFFDRKDSIENDIEY